MAGFAFRYRANGGQPTVREFPSRNGGFAKGDIANFEDGGVDIGVTGDSGLLGAALEIRDGDRSSLPSVRVVVDADAVYGVEDPYARTAGTTLDLTGGSGAQGVGPSRNGEFSVVADCPAGEETLVQIHAGKHHTRELDDGPRPVGGELNAALARAVVRYYRDHFGRGPTKAQAFYRGTVIVVLLNDTMTKAERSLAAAGKIEAVMQLREAFQESMRNELAQTVERLVGSKVVAFMSSNHIDPDMAAEIFVLERPVQGEPTGAAARD
jgi:uncharacterized protein YbcI